MDLVGLRGQGETQCYGSFFEDAFSRSASLFYTLHPKSPSFCGHLPSYVSCTSEFLPFLALQVVVLLSFSGSTERPSLIGVPSTDRIHPSFGTYGVTEFAHSLASASGLRDFRFHVFLVTSPPVGLAPVSASCFESSVVSGLVCCLPFPSSSVGVRPFGFHRSESS